MPSACLAYRRARLTAARPGAGYAASKAEDAYLSVAQAFAATGLFALRSCMLGGAEKAAADATHASATTVLRITTKTLKAVSRLVC